MQEAPLNLRSFTGKMKILHLSWVAFFLTFMVWFNHAPLLGLISETLSLTKAQISTLLVLNVALAIPARIIVGMLTDRFGPRIVYTLILASVSIPCWVFAFADDLALAILDMPLTLPEMARVFHLFSRFSNLCLNFN